MERFVFRIQLNGVIAEDQPIDRLGIKNRSVEGFKLIVFNHNATLGSAVEILLLSLQTDDRILCIPFAYSKGWKATDNGKSVKVIKVNGMFCGIVLKPGTHNIKLNYTTPGLKIGTCISLISLIILIGIAIRSRKKLLKD